MARAMKDSGIEWIGVIPETWRVVRGKTVFRQRNEKGNDVCLQLLSPTQKYGVIPQTEYEQLSGMKAVKLDIAADYSQLKTIHEGDFCISLRSFQGGFEYSQHEGVVSPAYQVFYPHIDCNDEYFKYLFKDRTFIDKMNSYTLSLRDGKNIAFSDFANTYIPFPPIDEQTRIAAFLDTECARIDAVIEQTRASIEEYKKLKQSVITEAVTKGIRPSRKMKDSGVEWIGGIPEEWDLTTVGRIATVVRGASPRPAGDPRYFNGNDTPWITVAEVTNGNGKYIYRTETYLTEEGAKQSRRVEVGTLLLSNSGATLGVPKITKISGCINDGSLAFYNLQVNQDYLLYVFAGQTNELRKQMQGYGQPNLNTTIVKGIKLPLPPREEQKEISVFLDEIMISIDALILKKESLVCSLESYKKSLLFEYVTGKKEV